MSAASNQTSKDLQYEYTIAVKEYFVFVSRLVPQEDLELAGYPICDHGIDFVAHVEPEKVAEVEDKISDFSYELQHRTGVHLSTVVVPKESVTIAEGNSTAA